MGSRWVTALTVGVLLAGCGQTSGPAATDAGRPAASGPLAGVCPNPVVVQTDWFPEAEYGAYFQLLGDPPAFDTANKRVRAPLVARGVPAGVDLEIRSGGPAIGFQQVSAQLYADPAITFGLLPTDEAVQNAGRLPTRAVLAPLELSPMMIMWDRTRHPDVKSIADLGRASVPVLYYQTDTYMQYLLGTGVLTPQQVDGSYDGSPARWVTSGGEIAEGGFATAEPYIYAGELGDGHRYDVAYQLVSDTGYSPYPMALSVRKADQERLAPCLRALVPMVQRAQVDFVTDPARATGLIVAAVRADNGSVWSYSPGLAQYAVRTMREKGLVSNGANGTLGDIDPPRVAKLIEILTPILAGQQNPVPPGLTPDALFTNEFVDPAIGLPPS